MIANKQVRRGYTYTYAYTYTSILVHEPFIRVVFVQDHTDAPESSLSDMSDLKGWSEAKRRAHIVKTLRSLNSQMMPTQHWPSRFNADDSRIQR